jgi:predicted nucleic acid-binding protein
MNQETQSLDNQSVFIDKTAFIPFMNPEHPRYLKARSLFLELDDLERPLVTSNFVIFDTHEWLRNEIGYDHAQFFMNTVNKAVQKGALSLVPVYEKLEEEAKELLIDYPNFEFSMIEALTVTGMKKHNIYRIFTFNPRFRNLTKLQPEIKVIPSSI